LLDHITVVCSELLLGLSAIPVALLGIISAEHNGDNVWRGGHCSRKRLLAQVCTIPTAIPCFLALATRAVPQHCLATITQVRNHVLILAIVTVTVVQKQLQLLRVAHCAA
jgi:hypothetical protein